MQIPTPSEIRDLEALAALHTASGGGRSDTDPVRAVRDVIGDRDAAYAWMREMEQADLVEVDGGLVPMARVSRQGRAIVEAATARRRDRSGRRETLRRRLLAWTDEHSSGPSEQINAEGFLTAPHAWIDGGRATFEELASAAGSLLAQELAAGEVYRSGQTPVRVDLAITEDGQSCLDDFDGDFVAFTASRQHPSPGHVFHIGSVTGSSLAVGGHGATVSAATTNNNGEAAAVVGRAVRQVLGTLNLSAAELARAEEHLSALEEGTDGTKVSRALRWVAGFTTSTATGAAGQLLGGVAAGLLGMQA
ncbi:hypothetical protein ACFQ36_07045 [Arthrobacter sp. GCM10027362]|uniref:hypothetical protein n=1 Tax=Arthrobacter sp. GCM10027362 TaxID=3273379 RepID=UPI00362AF7CF